MLNHTVYHSVFVFFACSLCFACSANKMDTTSPETQDSISVDAISEKTPNAPISIPHQTEKPILPSNSEVPPPLSPTASTTTCRDFWTKPNPIPKEKQRPFIITYETYKKNVEIIIDVYTKETLNSVVMEADIEYDCDMDGIYEETYQSKYSGHIICSFKKPGKHQIAMRGDIPILILDAFDDYTYPDYNLFSIDQWGDIRWKILYGPLSATGKYSPITKGPHYPVLKAKDIPNLRDTCDISGLFEGNIPFNEDIRAWDVSHVENMHALFFGCTSFNQDISQWNVSRVMNMRGMLQGATTFNQNIGNWDVANVRNMGRMFEEATSFNQDIGAWNVSSVEFMYGMFQGATSFNQDISQWDVAKVNDMSTMFKDATSFNQDISQWNVAKVEDMNAMFENATSFNQDISQWNVSKVRDMCAMFKDATSFDQDISRWDISSIRFINQMFTSTKEKNKIICPKCEVFRQKVLQKNETLPKEDKLEFD